MSDIKQTSPIAPVLPSGTGNTICRDDKRRKPPREQDKREQRQPDRDDDHHVDEYA